MKFLFVLRDDVSGRFGDPFVAPNVSDVVRSLSDSQTVPFYVIRDVSVLELATYDDSGDFPVITPCMPTVVVSGPTLLDAWKQDRIRVHDILDSSNEGDSDET